MQRGRILVWGLSNNRAGTEGVIYNYATHAEGVRFDFLCYEEPHNYSKLFSESTDNRYFVIPIKIKHPIAYMKALRRFMRDHGHEYSALWFNTNDVSNIDLLILARRYGIERRITHAHNSSIPNRLITKLFSWLNWNKCRKLTTERWACGEAAGRFFYGDDGFLIVPNKVDADARRFSAERRVEVREKHGLQEAKVVGTLGRLAEQKNQAYLIRLMPALLANNPDTCLLFVGEGPLEEELRSLACEVGVEGRVIFAGQQADVGAYLSAMDVFAFPSFYEGLSLAILEAQYNGLPCVVSEGVSEESVISRSVSQVSLDDAEGWIRCLSESVRQPDSLILDRAERYNMEDISDLASAMFLGQSKSCSV